MISATWQHENFPRVPSGYFDTAAVGTVPTAVTAAVGDVARALEHGLIGSPDWHRVTDDTFELIADDFGVGADQLTTVANTGTAVASVAHAIELTPNDEVLTFADDFPNIRLAWTTTAARVREAAVTVEARRTDALIAEITPRTRVVAVTHVHATTGTTIDLQRVFAACRENGSLLVVDGAQAAGITVPGAQHADVYVASSYKWLLAGFGGAVIATGPRFAQTARAGLVGYMNMNDPTNLAVGHDPLYIQAALAAAARVRQECGRENIRDHTARLLGRISIDASAMGYECVTHDPAGILALHTRDAPGLVAALRERGLITTFRGGYLRLSPYLATTDSDVDLLLTALEDLRPAFAGMATSR